MPQAQGGGWLALYGKSELETSSAFLLLTWSCGESRAIRASPPTPLGRLRADLLVALGLEASRAFFSAAIAFLSSKRNTGLSSNLELVLIKANSSYLGITPTAGAHPHFQYSLSSAGLSRRSRFGSCPSPRFSLRSNLAHAHSTLKTNSNHHPNLPLALLLCWLFKRSQTKPKC